MIKIIANTTTKKGELFENFVKQMLDGLGYYDFRTVRKTGRQIDIFAKDRVTEQPIICECKAHENRLDGDHLSKFRGLYDTEYDNDNSLIGLFFSLSGFNDGFLEYYDELNKEFKKRFKIFPEHKIYNFLEKSKSIESNNFCRKTIENKLTYDIKRQYLTITEFGEFWTFTFGIEGKETHFTLLSSKGNEVQNYIFDELRLIDSNIKNLTPINLNVRNKTIISLCNSKDKKIEKISKEIQESFVDIELVLQNLVKDNLVKSSDNNFSISDELEQFIKLSTEFLSSKYKTEYFRSKYVQSNINDRLINYIQSRFYLDLETLRKQALIKILGISPTALLHSLTMPTIFFKNGYEQISKGNFSKETIKLWKESSISNLYMDLMTLLISDIKTYPNKILTDKHIKGYSLNLKIKFATLNDLYLKIELGSFFMLEKAGGKIKKGSLVKASNLTVFLNSALVYTHIEEYDLAIDDYNRVISESNDSELLKTAWYCKGQIYSNTKKYDKALDCYNEAIKIDPNLKESYYNKGKVLLVLNRNNEAKQQFEKAIEIDPNYDEPRKYLN